MVRLTIINPPIAHDPFGTTIPGYCRTNNTEYYPYIFDFYIRIEITIKSC